MKKTPFAFILFVFTLLLSGCMTPPAEQTWDTTTPDQSDIQMYLDAERAQGTLEVVQAQMSATAKVQQATAAVQTAQARVQETQRAWELIQATMQAGDANNTATAQAGYQIGTSTAQAANDQATSIAAAEGTQTAVAATETSIVATATAQWQATQDTLQLTADTNALNAANRAQNAEAEIAELALERERRMNIIIAIAPWVLGVVSFGLVAVLIGYAGHTLIQRMKVFRGKDGKVDVILNATSQGTQVWKPDRVTGPIITVDNHNQVDAPQLPHQAETTLLAMLPPILQAIQNRQPGSLRQPWLADEFIQQMRTLLGMTTPPQISSGRVVDIEVIDAEDPEVKAWIDDVADDFTQKNILH